MLAIDVTSTAWAVSVLEQDGVSVPVQDVTLDVVLAIMAESLASFVENF
jgi:hypothetical protein